jgi:uncharacterized membrane protein
MTAADANSLWPFAAILAMAAATAFMRLGGYWLMATVPVTRRVRRMLDALPGSVITATIVPVVVNNGVSAALGVAVVAGMMIFRRNEFLAVFAGLVAVTLARATGF